MGKIDKKKGFWRKKIPFVSVWLVSGRELAKLDSLIALLSKKYADSIKREHMRNRIDTELLVKAASEKAIKNLRKQNQQLFLQLEEMRRKGQL